MELKEWLRSICSSPSRTSHFLSLLAEMEGIGAYKIRRCIEDHNWGEAEWRHLSEESSHSALFRRLVARRLGEPDSVESEKIAQIAHEYFDPLDHGTSDHLTAIMGGYNPRVCYAVVSYLVERRAIKVYRAFREFVEDLPIVEALDAVLGDEETHLVNVEKRIAELSLESGKSFSLSEFASLEETLFVNLQGQFSELMERERAASTPVFLRVAAQ